MTYLSYPNYGTFSAHKSNAASPLLVFVLWNSGRGCRQVCRRATQGPFSSKGAQVSEIAQKAKALYAQFSDLNAGTYASSIAFFSFLSLVPMLIICISLVSMLGFGEEEVIVFFTSLVPNDLDGFATMLIRDAFDKAGFAFSISTISMLWSASMGIKELRRGLNVAYGVEETRSAIVASIISVFAAVILGSLLAVMMYLIFSDSVVSLLARYIPNFEGSDRSSVLSTLRTLLLAIPVIAICYAYLPAGTRRFTTQLPGAACASFACAVLSFGFHFYLDVSGNTSSLYGSFAAVVLFLYWMYGVCLILVAGGFINRVLSERSQASSGDTDGA